MTATKPNPTQRRAELARRLATLSPKARLDALLSETDARAAVRSVPSEDLYLTILDLGLDDASELVQLSSPVQFRAFVDLAAWRGDRVDPREVLAWLRAARAQDGEGFLSKVHALDVELLESTLRALVEVHDLEENPDVETEGVALTTAEGRYLIEIHAEDADLSTLRGLVHELIAESPFEATRFFESLRWQLPSELEETAHRFRSARLADLGFPELYDAMGLFAYVDPDLHAPAPLASLTGSQSLARSAQGVDFVELAFRQLEQTERDALTQHVRYLVNSALVAEGADPGDPVAIRRVSEMAREYLRLGLEHLCGGDGQRAAEAIRTHPLRRIFQVGFSLTLQLKFEVERLEKEPLAKLGEQWLVTRDLEPQLLALTRRRPMRAVALEGADPMPFRARWELLDTRAKLARAEQQRELFVALLSTPEAAGQAIRALEAPPDARLAETALTAAVCQAALGGSPTVAPLPRERVVELFERLFTTDVPPRIRSETLERLRRVWPPGAEASRLLDETLARLTDELPRARTG